MSVSHLSKPPYKPAFYRDLYLSNMNPIIHALNKDKRRKPRDSDFFQATKTYSWILYRGGGFGRVTSAQRRDRIPSVRPLQYFELRCAQKETFLKPVLSKIREGSTCCKVPFVALWSPGGQRLAAPDGATFLSPKVDGNFSHSRIFSIMHEKRRLGHQGYSMPWWHENKNWKGRELCRSLFFMTEPPCCEY